MQVVSRGRERAERAERETRVKAYIHCGAHGLEQKALVLTYYISPL